MDSRRVFKDKNIMDTTLPLTVFGLLLGLWSIYLAIRTRYPARITFFKEQSIGLFDSIVRNLPELSVLYNNEPVSQNLVLLKGFFLNTGSKDITESLVEDKLAVQLPTGFRWLTARIVSSNGRASVKVPDEGTKLIFELGLFKRYEHVRFEALAEIPVSTSGQKHEYPGLTLEKALTFSHRIADTRKVEKRVLPPQQPWTIIDNLEKYPSLRKLVTPGFLDGLADIGIIVSALIFLALIVFGAIKKPWEQNKFLKTTYLLRIENEGLIEVDALQMENNTLKLVALDGSYSETVPIIEFYENRQWYPKVGVYTNTIVSVLGAFLFLIFGVTGYFVIYFRRRRARNLRRLIASESPLRGASA